MESTTNNPLTTTKLESTNNNPLTTTKLESTNNNPITTTKFDTTTNNPTTTTTKLKTTTNNIVTTKNPVSLIKTTTNIELLSNQTKNNLRNKDLTNNKLSNNEEKIDAGIIVLIVIIILILFYLTNKYVIKKYQRENSCYVCRKSSSKIYPIVSPRQVKLKIKRKFRKIRPLDETDIKRFEVNMKNNNIQGHLKKRDLANELSYYNNFKKRKLEDEKIEYIENIMNKKNKNKYIKKTIIKEVKDNEKIKQLCNDLKYYNNYKKKNRKQIKKEHVIDIVVDNNKKIKEHVIEIKNKGEKKTIKNISNELIYFNNFKNKKFTRNKKKKKKNQVDIIYLNKPKKDNFDFKFEMEDGVPKINIKLEDILSTYKVSDKVKNKFRNNLKKK